MGELDEISRVIGNQEANISNLLRTFEQHCEDDDRRHVENVSELKLLNANLSKLNQALAPVVQTVADMKPIVDSYQVTRWKLIGAVGAGSTLLTLLAWLISLAGGAILSKMGLR